MLEQMAAGQSAAPGSNQVGDPNPSLVETFSLEVREMLELLNDEQLKQVAILRWEGYTNKEIAGHLGIALRSVERKLHLIRQKWES